MDVPKPDIKVANLVGFHLVVGTTGLTLQVYTPNNRMPRIRKNKEYTDIDRKRYGL